ncbi:MAG: hypothetical protein ACAH59_09370 [Pseudobdellovibrionaceae bacterium]
MKRIAIVLGLTLVLILGLSIQAKAWVSHDASEKLYSFKYRMQNETFEVSQKSGSYEEAFERAAKACYRHFKAGRRLSEDRGLDIIDVCANPRTT